MLPPEAKKARHVFLDFDSTLVACEALEVLADVAARRRSAEEARRLRQQVELLTELAMAGQAHFGQALQRRIRIIRPTRLEVAETRTRVARAVLPDAAATVAALLELGKEVWVLSGGLRAIVEPVSRALGVDAEHVLCNDLVFEEGAEEAVAVDPDNPLAHDGGKARAVHAICRREEAVVVGDGATDLEVRTLAAAEWFVCHAGVRRRAAVVEKADAVIERLAELPALLS